MTTTNRATGTRAPGRFSALRELFGRGPARTLLWQVVREQRWWIRAAIAASALSFVAQIALGQAAVRAIDDGIDNATSPLGPLVLRMAFWGLTQVTLSTATVLLLMRVRWTVDYRVRTSLHRSLVAAAVDDTDVATGQVVTRAVADLGQLNNVVYLVPILVGAVPAVLSGMAYLGYLNFPLMLVTFSSLPVNLWLVRRIRGRVGDLSWLQLQETGEVTRAIDEPIRGIRVVKLFGRETAVIDGVRQASLAAYRYAVSRVRFLARWSALLKLVPALSQAALLLLGARGIRSGWLTTGEFLVFFVGSGQVTYFARSFVGILDAWSFASTGGGRIGELVDPDGIGVGQRMVDDDRRAETGDALDAFGAPQLGWACDGLVVRVGAGATEPLHAVVAPGEVALVRAPAAVPLPVLGATLLGELAPAQGSVRLESVDLHELPNPSARRALRLLDSEPYLFARSVRENLLLGAAGSAGTPDGESLELALWASHADEVVAGLDGGLDEVLGDRALNLSGGQRQRLALAQALVARPRVLMLVEALSGVHAEMEADILTRVRTAYPATVVLHATARPSAAGVVDQVLDVRLAVGAVPADGGAAEPLEADAPGRPEVPAPVTSAGTDSADGAVPLVEESPRCDPEAERRPGLPTVGSLATPFRTLLVGLTVAMVVLAVFDLVPQFLFGRVNDAVEDEATNTDRFALALVGVAVFGAGVQWWFDVNASRLSNGMLYLLRVRLVRRLSRLGLAYYDRELPGYVATRVLHDLEEITAFARAVATRLAVVALSLVAAVVAMALVGTPILALILAIIGAAVLLTVSEVPIARRAYLRQRAALGDVIARLEEDYNGRGAIHGAVAGAQATASFDELALRLRRAERWSAMVSGSYTMCIQWIAEIGGALIIWRSGLLVLDGALALGALLTVRLYLSRVLEPIAELGSLVQQYLRARVSFDRLGQPYQAAVLPVDRPDARTCDALAGDIVFDGVSFRYPETDRPVLRDVSLVLPAGRTIAVVGPTGAGKSTVAKLVARVYDPDEGRVTVGGDDLTGFTSGSLRRRIGVVPQEPFLFAGTVADNIAYGRPDAAREELLDATRAVGAEAGLAELAGGLDAPVIEEGLNLSPQQRQLVALARAWLVRPDILVLDEATSALDEPTERLVLDALATRDGTTLFVTHREQVAAAADLRLVVDGVGMQLHEREGVPT